MYPNILVSILIMLIALQVIGGMLGSRKLIKGAGIGMVLLVASALIIWILLGLSPLPVWFTKLVGRIVRLVTSAVAAVAKRG